MFTPPPNVNISTPTDDIYFSVSAGESSNQLDLAVELAITVGMLVGSRVTESDIYILPPEENTSGSTRRFGLRVMKDEPLDPAHRTQIEKVVTALSSRAFSNANADIRIAAEGGNAS